MPDLSVKYMGLNLKNPLIAGSSGLTATITSLLELQQHGVSAVILKSLFEEDLVRELKINGNQTYPYPASGEYIGPHSKNAKVDDYLNLIEDAKKNLSIPVIASINCISNYEWTSFARKIESAGADGLELNLFIPPSDPIHNSEDNEKIYFDILTDVRRQVKLPLAVKIGPYFSGMTKMALKLSWTGISGMVLFNRFYQPDIDIDEMKVVGGKILSTPDEILLPLRWTALLSDRVMCDIAGSTGVHDAAAIIKFLLAGAKAVQATSVFYKQGAEHARTLLDGLSEWMQGKGYTSIHEFNGALSLKKTDNPADYERFQYFMAYHTETLQ